MLLITVLSETLKCRVSPDIINGEVNIDSVTYQDVGQGDWTGFYDFLRTQEGDIIGIRYAPLVDDPSLLGDVGNKSYARVLPNAAFELFFSGERSFVPEMSTDQDFGDNMVLRSTLGEYALTFGLDDLEPRERAQLKSLAGGGSPRL